MELLQRIAMENALTSYTARFSQQQMLKRNKTYCWWLPTVSQVALGMEKGTVSEVLLFASPLVRLYCIARRGTAAAASRRRKEGTTGRGKPQRGVQYCTLLGGRRRQGMVEHTRVSPAASRDRRRADKAAASWDEAIAAAHTEWCRALFPVGSLPFSGQSFRIPT